MTITDDYNFGTISTMIDNAVDENIDDLERELRDNDSI